MARKGQLYKKYKANWSKVKIDQSKTLQENVEFSHEQNVQEAIDRVHASLRSVAAEIRPATVLDIGCGVGLYLDDFETGVAKHGTDLSADFIREAKARIPEGVFMTGDFMTLQMGARYDLIYSISVLEYIPPSQLNAFFARIAMLLNPGGVVFIQYPHALSGWQTLYPDLSYIQYSPRKIVTAARAHFDIIASRHSYDNRALDCRYDNLRYDPDREKSFRNGALLIARKK